MNTSICQEARTEIRIQGRVDIILREQLSRCDRWARSFAGKRKDRLYYEVVEDTIRDGFDYCYLAIRDEYGEICAIQPCFVLDQDLLVGIGPVIATLTRFVRRAWPRFMRMRTLMLGCVAGEGHLDDTDGFPLQSQVPLLAWALVRHARRIGASLIVLKEFPGHYRVVLDGLLECGFTRVPSMPMTKLNIDYPSFDAYTKGALNSATRSKLRKKFRATAQAPPIEMSVVEDVSPIIDALYPLYLQVYKRSRLHFEKLTKEYFCELGRRMPTTVRYFVWRQHGRIIAFTLCMIESDAIYAEYIGLDYPLAIDLHLYHYAVRDMITWAIANDYKWFRSSGLNYDPKLHLRHVLDPLDLYVRHVSRAPNLLLKWLLPLIEPTHRDRTLKKFANYADLWGDAAPGRRYGGIFKQLSAPGRRISENCRAVMIYR